jgi:hypothetical protein
METGEESLLGENAGKDNARGSHVHPGLRKFAHELTATCVRVFAYVAALGVLIAVGFKFFGKPQVDIEPVRSAWTAVERPYRAFALTVPEFVTPEPDYAIHRHAGGGRKDIMSWGDASGSGSRLMLEIYRPGQELKRFDDAASEVKARTADLGGPYALKAADPIESKFGRVATFDFVASAGKQARNCLGFVRAFDDPRLQIAGWYCKGAREVVDRSTLACGLDRLSLVMAASEPKVSELFAEAELKRKFCTQKVLAKAIKGTTAKRNDWLEAPKEPKLRGRVAGR